MKQITSRQEDVIPPCIVLFGVRWFSETIMYAFAPLSKDSNFKLMNLWIGMLRITSRVASTSSCVLVVISGRFILPNFDH